MGRRALAISLRTLGALARSGAAASTDMIAKSLRIVSLSLAIAFTSATAIFAQPSPVSATIPTATSTVPFGVGEQMKYDVRFGPLKVGEGSMEVLEIGPIRGDDAWHTRFRVKGGVPFYRVDDMFESWIRVKDFNSLRFVQDLEEGGKTRERHFELFPERSMFQENEKPEEASVAEPLDDGSFLFFVRTIPLEVGQSYEFNRYFRPDRNPVVVRVLGREKITVPAGTFNTIVLQPVIKSKGIFSEKGQAMIWLSDDSSRIMVQMKTHTSVGSLNLYLKSHRPPTAAATPPANR